jgi:hypothetical protein
MRRALAAISGIALLIISAHRLPAPITEQSPSPTQVPPPPQAEQMKHKPSGSSSIARFEGTWRASEFRKAQNGNTFSLTQTMIVGSDSAEYVQELTSTLASGRKWADLPAPYNSTSPVYRKGINKSTNIKTEGSNLKIQWAGFRLTDWNPKTIPISAFKNTVGRPSTVLLVLSGDHLIVTSGKHSQTYSRIR